MGKVKDLRSFKGLWLPAIGIVSTMFLGGCGCSNSSNIGEDESDSNTMTASSDAPETDLGKIVSSFKKDEIKDANLKLSMKFKKVLNEKRNAALAEEQMKKEEAEKKEEEKKASEDTISETAKNDNSSSNGSGDSYSSGESYNSGDSYNGDSSSSYTPTYSGGGSSSSGGGSSNYSEPAPAPAPAPAPTPEPEPEYVYVPQYEEVNYYLVSDGAIFYDEASVNAYLKEQALAGNTTLSYSYITEYVLVN